MEMARKYNHDLKHLNDTNCDYLKEKMLKNSNSITVETQTENLNLEKIDSSDLDQLKLKLYDIKLLLEENENKSDNCDLKSLNLNNLIQDLEIMARKVQKNMQINKNELNKIKTENNRLEIDFKKIKDSKQKLESLYKVKCKSDLNKSAQIKKIEINYQCELMKFRNEFNSDVIRYLENKIVLKDSLLNENLNKLNKLLNVFNCEQNTNDVSILKSKLEKLKDSIQNLINSSLFTNSNMDLNNNYLFNETKLNLDNIYKKVPLNLIVKNELNNDLKVNIHSIYNFLFLFKIGLKL